MRRTAAVFLMAAALVASFVSPADAATTVVKTLAVDSNTFDGPIIASLPCTGAALDTQGMPPRTVIYPSMTPAAPSGTTAAAWGQHFASVPTEADAYGPVTDFSSASALATFKMDIYGGTSGIVAVQAGSQSEHWVGKAPVTGPAGAWATVDGAAQTLTWTQYSPSAGTPTGVTATGTIADFAAAHPSVIIYSGLIGFGCDGQDFRFQNLQTGQSGSPADVMVFGTLTDNVQIKPSASFIAAGGTATIAGSSQYGGSAYATLNYKAANSTTYVTVNRSVAAQAVDDLTCDDHFVCRNQFSAAVMHPLYNTIYKWSYPAGNGVDGAVSTYIMVHVQSKISPKFPTSISRGRAFTITGSTTPAKPGTVIGLWARHGYTTTRLATARVGSNGTFTIVGTAGDAGSWLFWLTLPNDKLNAASKSASKAYSVR